MDVDFVIPLSKDDLLSGEAGFYVVDEILSVRVLPNKLRACLADLRSGGPLLIVENFDCFFSVLRHFNELESSLKEEVWDALLYAISKFTNVLPSFLEDGDVDFQIRRTHLNTLKMLCYLLAQLADAFEAEATKPSTEVIVAGKKKGKSSSSKKKISNSWEWDEQHNDLLQTLGQLMQLDINRLWEPPVVEEEFVNLITGCCYKFLENPATVKIGTTKELIFNLLGVMVKKYNYGLGVSLKIVQLLQHFEHLVQPLAQAVEMFINEFGVKSVVSEVIREIGRMDPRDLARDTSGTRAYSDFLIELAGRVPSQIIPNISVLLCHLNGESLLQLPLDHLQKNLSKEMAKLKEMAPHLDGDEDGRVPVVLASENVAAKVWEAMRPEVQATIEEYVDNEEIIDEDDGPVEFQGDVRTALVSALKQIKTYLNQGHHKKALAVLKAAMVTWPEESMFLVAEKEQSTMVNNQQSEEIERDNMASSVEEQLLIMKAIFLAPDDSEASAPDQDEVIDPNELLQVSTEHGSSSSSQATNGIVNEITKQQMVVQFLKDYVHFQTQMEKAIPTVCQLLGSKTISDVNESIEFFVVASEFGLRSAILGVRRMLVLIWSRDNAVRDAVVEAYKGLYLDPEAPNARAKAALIVKNLITLTQGASIGDLTSLEELMSELMKGRLIPSAVIKLLWEKFTMKAPQTTAEESRAALMLLGMLAGAETDIVRSNIDVLVSTGLGPRAEDDFQLARITCVALRKLGKIHKKPGCSAEEPVRFAASHAIFERLTEIVVSGVRKLNKPDWTPMMEQALNVIYFLAEHPETIAENILQKMATCLLEKSDNYADTEDSPKSRETENAFDDTTVRKDNRFNNLSTTCDPGILARFLSFAGHVAMRHMVHLDVAVLGEIKRRQVIEEDDKEKNANKRKGTGSVPSTNTSKDPGTSETIEEELGLTGASADDVESEYVRKICEHEIVTGNTLLSKLHPLLVCVCSNPVKYSDPTLRASASLALAKFMLVRYVLSSARSLVISFYFIPLTKERPFLPTQTVLPFLMVVLCKGASFLGDLYLLSFIQKDRQSESLVEKLCHRFRATKTERQWRDLAFCLSLLSYNERGIRKLQENFACFHDKLAEDDVYQCFVVIVSKSKKFAKPEVKALVEELEQRITQCHTKGMEDVEDYERASRALGAVGTGANKTKKGSNTPAGKTTGAQKGRTPATKKKRQKKTVDSSDEEHSPMPLRTPRNAPRPPKPGCTKSTNRRQQMMSVFESDDEDSIELFSLDEENADKELTLDSEGEENVNPNASSGSKMKSSKSQRGVDPRIARSPSRRHLVSNT
ncbi:PREDICTED: condensin complex subunit 1-like [Acropora digitifera]|uniref:condensin complex subunit 1-like n=1 Tax=Acropora digitifera TaxID=70779 RepID=UPI00077AF06D|nr:PREDICTED: condensin complex subunit 1-like [Acropora digitifera]